VNNVLFKFSAIGQNKAFFFANSFITYGVNVFSYSASLLTVILILILFGGNHTHTHRALSNSADHMQVRLTASIAILSLSGIPPLFGFFSKFFFVTLLMSKGGFVITTLFVAFNLFALYFYLQQLRYTLLTSGRRDFLTDCGALSTSQSALTGWSFLFLLATFGGPSVEMLCLVLSNAGA